MRSTIIITLTLLAGSAVAQFSGISSACAQAATGLFSTPFASCSQLLSLISVVSASGSIVTPVNGYLSSVCPVTPCTPDVANTAAAALRSGCSSDISSGTPLASVLVQVVGSYPTVRDALCTRYTSNNTYCLTQILTDAQTASGQPITATTILEILGGSVSNVSRSALCTDCGKALVTDLKPVVANSSAVAATNLTSQTSATCGVSFNDGQLPASVAVQSGSASAASGSASTSAKPGSAVAVHSLNWTTLSVVVATLVATAFGTALVL